MSRKKDNESTRETPTGGLFPTRQARGTRRRAENHPADKRTALITGNTRKFVPLEVVPTKEQLRRAAQDDFYDRAEALRPGFGAWDWTDLAAKAILDLVTVQNQMTRRFRLEADGNADDLTVLDELFRARVIAAAPSPPGHHLHGELLEQPAPASATLSARAASVGGSRAGHMQHAGIIGKTEKGRSLISHAPETSKSRR